jgi:O-acetyl-ADP-ribose deacetylase (regulator of RNase III)
MKIVYEKGYTADKNVDVIINSANGFLLLGTSGAGELRKKSGNLNLIKSLEYKRILDKLPEKVSRWYIRAYKKYGWQPSNCQLSCIKLLLNNHQVFEQGTAILDTYKLGKKSIIHAIGMSYEIKDHGSERKKATVDTIRESLKNAFKIIKENNYKSVAVPLMCVRKEYGITPAQSFKITIDAIKMLEESSVNKVILCFDNAAAEEYMKGLA